MCSDTAGCVFLRELPAGLKALKGLDAEPPEEDAEPDEEAYDFYYAALTEALGQLNTSEPESKGEMGIAALSASLGEPVKRAPRRASRRGAKGGDA